MSESGSISRRHVAKFKRGMGMVSDRVCHVRGRSWQHGDPWGAYGIGSIRAPLIALAFTNMWRDGNELRICPHMALDALRVNTFPPADVASRQIGSMQ